MGVKSLINENATRLRELHEALHREHRRKPRSPEHRSAAALFSASYDALAYPGGLTQGLAALKRLEPQAVEIAVRFLEADPWFHRSGYIKEEILQRLKHAVLKPVQVQRLSLLLIRSLTSGTGRVFRSYKNLSPKLDTERIRIAAEVLKDDENPEVRRRADRHWPGKVSIVFD